MDQNLLRAVSRGDVDEIKQLSSSRSNVFTGRTTVLRNTILHIAARLGNKNVVQEILTMQPSLLYEPNLKGKTPMHIAAAAGDSTVVKLFIDNQSKVDSHFLRVEDQERNTPLHIAVRNHHLHVVQKLTVEDPGAILCVNGAGQTPLSIAVDASFTDIIKWIIYKDPNSLNYRGTHRLTLLHSAVIRQDYVVVVWILDARRELISCLDEHDRNALHYAAASGHVKMTQHLLKIDASIAHQSDCDGQTPLHLAAKNGQVSVMKILLNDHPDATEVLDHKSRNILHLAAENGHVKTVLFILKLPEIEDLINSPDEGGNTPLHMAAMNLHNYVVYILSRNMMVNIRTTNFGHKTAKAVAETSTDHEREIEKHLTIKALKLAYAKRALYPEDILENNVFCRSIQDTNKGLQGKGMAQTLTVIATLIATFTFAAAFAIPGGYISDGPDQGAAALIRKSAFRAFAITDTIAMTSSMTAAVIVFWSLWANKSESLIDTLPLAIGLTWIGLVSMAIAFVTGLFAVLSNNMPLAIVVCLVGCALPFIFYVFAPFFSIISEVLPNSLHESEVINPFAFILNLLNLHYGRYMPKFKYALSK